MKKLLTLFLVFWSVTAISATAQNENSLQGDFQALQDIYEVTDGDNWKNNSGWSSMTPETMGDAHGVEVWESGVHQGRVRVLFLFDNGLTNIQRDGSGDPDLDEKGRYQLIDGMNLKESLGNLKQMQYIDLRTNELTGTIPDSFWFLSNLKIAVLGFVDQTKFGSDSNNLETRSSSTFYPSKGPYRVNTGFREQSNNGAQYYGGIPSTISNMTSLEIFLCERNYFDQTSIPPELFQLPSLVTLNIGHNGFTGGLENNELPPNINEITIRGGSFDSKAGESYGPLIVPQYFLSGDLPPLWGNSNTIERLDLSFQDFSGVVPSEWSGMSNMFGFYLEFNRSLDMDVNILDSANMPRLNTFRLGRMSITGAFNSDFTTTANRNAVFSVEFNDMSGELPDAVKNISNPDYPTDLRLFGIQNNNFTGSFMDDMSGLFQVRAVGAQHNNFIGPLPVDYPRSTNLNTFYLSNNAFTGAIPATVGNMVTPYAVAFNDNNLSSYEAGAISPVIFDQKEEYISGLRKLKSFAVHNNALSQSDLDQIILDMWANVQSRIGTEYENWGNSARLTLENQSTGAVPSYSSDVNAAIMGLTAAGWEVKYDGWENDDRAVVPELPETPSLLSPSDQSTNVSLTPAFEWESTGASTYRVEIFESSSSEQIIFRDQEQTAYVHEVKLDENTEYTWRVRAIDGGIQSDWSESRAFTTLTANDDTEDPGTDTGSKVFPESPLLLGPVNNELNSSITPEFRWTAVEGADYYTLHMSRNSPDGMVIDVTLEDTVYTHPEMLGDNSVHNWRVRAVKDGEPGEWSEIFELQTEDSGQPQMADLVSPDHFTQNVSVSPRFEWDQVDSDLFEIRIIDKVTSETVLKDELSGYQYTPDNPLAGETVYIWQVKNVKDGIEGAWSPRWEFATGEYDYVTSSPLLLSPDNGAVYESLTPTFEWESVDADMYVISVSLVKPSKAKVLSGANQENTIIFEELPETYYTTEESLEPETTYYWRVKAIKNGEESDWSEIWEFITPDEETASDGPDEISQQIVLEQNYPNPFNPATQIQFSVSSLQEVSLKVYDLAGRQVADLVSGMMPAGNHEVTFRGDRLASGIYIYRLITDTQSFTKKMTLLK